MYHLTMLLFATTGGLVLSGIVANLYRLLARKPKGRPEKIVYATIMIVAGPSVLLDNATRSFAKRDCSNLAYGFAVGVTAYWSFALGQLLLTLADSV